MSEGQRRLAAIMFTDRSVGYCNCACPLLGCEERGERFRHRVRRAIQGIQAKCSPVHSKVNDQTHQMRTQTDRIQPRRRPGFCYPFKAARRRSLSPQLLRSRLSRREFAEPSACLSFDILLAQPLRSYQLEGRN